MKQIIKNYAFNKTAKTITFTDFASIALDRLLLVTNVTAHTIVYQFNDPAFGGTVSGNVLTLAYNTSAMNSGDKLQIIYDCAAGDPIYDTTTTTMSGVYLTSPPTLNNGQRGDLQVDAQGRLVVNTAPLVASADSVATQGSYTELAGLTAGSLNADLVPSTDVSSYKWFSLQIGANAYAGTLTFQGSNDNGVWSSLLVHDATTASVVSTTGSTGRIFNGPINFRYLRVRMTSYTSGSAQGVLELYTSPNMPNGGSAVGAPTGSAVPPTAVYVAGVSAGGTLTGVRMADADGTSLALATGMYAYNGTGHDRVRSASVFRTITATSSTGTNLWQPAAGKRFRLMRYSIQVTGDVAVTGGGTVDVVLKDNAAGLAAAFSFYAPATAGTATGNGAASGWIDLGNGILSAAADNILVVGLSATLTSGKVRVVACGTEE